MHIVGWLFGLEMRKGETVNYFVLNLFPSTFISSIAAWFFI